MYLEVDKRSGCMEEQKSKTVPLRSRQEEGKDRKDMQKESKLVRCTLLNGSAWSTDRKYMRRYKGTF